MSMANYYECVDFWKRQGVEKEENLIALALNDVHSLDAHYSQIYEKILPIVMSAPNKEVEGFLRGLGM